MHSDAADATASLHLPAQSPQPARQEPGPSTHSLDPRWIRLTRTVSGITGGVLSTAHLVACGVLWLTREAVIAAAVTAAWIPVTGLLAWLAFGWPPIEYRHWRYRVDHDGLQIWSGVVWRRVVTVPRSRVQHIDVSQGPIERSYGLATLSVYTAGTEHSKVDLPGLDHAVAIALRDRLLPEDAEPAV